MDKLKVRTGRIIVGKYHRKFKYLTTKDAYCHFDSSIRQIGFIVTAHSFSFLIGTVGKFDIEMGGKLLKGCSVKSIRSHEKNPYADYVVIIFDMLKNED